MRKNITEMNDAMLEQVNGGRIVFDDHMVCAEDESGELLFNDFSTCVWEYNSDTFTTCIDLAKALVKAYNVWYPNANVSDEVEIDSEMSCILSA